MIKINNIDFPIYELDTVKSILNRLAASFNTLSEYLDFPNKLTLKDLHSQNIIIVDILKDIKTSPLTDLINKYKDVRKEFLTDKIIPIWMSYTKQFDIGTIEKDILDSKIGLIAFKIREMWTKKSINKKNLEEKIQTNKKNVKREEKELTKFETEESIISTSFIIHNIECISTLSIQNISLLEIFNRAILTEYVPFISVNDFYKISKDFKLPYLNEWVKTEKDSIILKVAFKKSFEKKDLSNYQDTIIKIDPISKDIYIKIKIHIDKHNISKEDYIRNSLSVFKNINTVDTKEVDVKGLFYFPAQNLLKYVFADLVMNDNTFKSLINIDDHLKTTKNKSELFIHFYHESTGNIKASLIKKKVDKKNIKEDNLDTDYFQKGDNYIRVNASGNNNESIEKFKNILGKLFTLYNNKFQEIFTFYSKYITNFGVEEAEEEEETEEKIKEIAPEVFIGSYSSVCQPKQAIPSIISEENLNINQEYLKFPRDKEDQEIPYISDGVNQQYYICKDSVYKYPGIKDNTLDNYKEYPYIPCCFKKNQKNKNKYLHYYQGQKLKDKQQNKEIKKSLKFLDNDEPGTLPENIEKLFSFIYNQNENFEFIRRGVLNTKNSFLNCVLVALETDIPKNKNEIEEFFKVTREGLATPELVSLCRQEMYDKTSQQIIEMLNNKDIYLDPKLFVHLLEEYFKCNIYIFSNMNNDSGEMILPNFIQSYYTHQNTYADNIFIYEHLGNESERIKHPYPQCELICRYNKTEIQDNFSFKEAENIRKIFSSMKESYSLDKLIEDTFMPIPKTIEIVSQWIDLYGKTRILNIKFNNKIISLSIDPIQPINVIEVKNYNIYSTDKETVKLLLKEFKIDNITNFYIGNVKASISIEKDTNISYLEIYNKNKKIARYLTEYTLWLYSKYLYSKKINIETFSKEHFKIDPSFLYGNISKKFKENNKSLMIENKLIVHDEETIKRLVYILNLNIQRDKNKILNYHKRFFIENYYVDLTDFKQHPNQVILFGDDSIQNWINENTTGSTSFTLYNGIKFGDVPYFFKNELIDDKVFLAQNTNDIGKASNIAITWNKQHYNLNIHVKDKISTPPFTLYAYKNPFDIKKYDIESKSSKNIKIMGYKIKNIPYYTVLLPL